MISDPFASILIEKFGSTLDGQEVEKYQLCNKNGMTVEVITFGGIITKLTAKDKNGNYQNVVLGFDNMSQYINNYPYFGAIIGRYGNRIAKGIFSIDKTIYELPINNGTNHLHGGTIGFDKVIWDFVSTEESDHGATITLYYLSVDMEMGYPGNLKIFVSYTLTNEDELKITYKATTDKKTVINPTHHSYFNLSGEFSNDILDHEVMINADLYLPVDDDMIPTGTLKEVSNTPFDFRIQKSIGKEIFSIDDQLQKGNGYDHCWVINGKGMRIAATVHHQASGRKMEVFTDEPGIQFYTGNYLDVISPLNGSLMYGQRSGFCLETQHFPDSPNHPNFPSVLLDSGQAFTSNTIYKFLQH